MSGKMMKGGQPRAFESFIWDRMEIDCECILHEFPLNINRCIIALAMAMNWMCGQWK